MSSDDVERIVNLAHDAGMAAIAFQEAVDALSPEQRRELMVLTDRMFAAVRRAP